MGTTIGAIEKGLQILIGIVQVSNPAYTEQDLNSFCRLKMTAIANL